MPARRTTEAKVAAAVKGAIAGGLDIGAVEVCSGGVVRILARDALTDHPDQNQGENTCDALFGGARR